MHPTSIERMPRAWNACTAAITASLLSWKYPVPSTLIVQGQGRTRPAAGSSRPLSTRAMAPSSVGGMALGRAASMAWSHWSYGVGGGGGP